MLYEGLEFKKKLIKVTKSSNKNRTQSKALSAHLVIWDYTNMWYQSVVQSVLSRIQNVKAFEEPSFLCDIATHRNILPVG